MQVTWDGDALVFVATEEEDQATLRTLAAQSELRFMVSRVEKDRYVRDTLEWTVEEIQMSPLQPPSPRSRRK